ncbi:hypothetical protein [Parasedimentitalea huanghaiensis]|uniref:Prepilin-type N-terminal cleavage/methylation domain-containing protein n=1 Tax=Parasedimentitalea huanghaiensis TaxID=2682100 RepID=A0A6L6WRB9_9RHOB|nr:hypothetical protein [Zongyanglinia huanghaiensis]MVO18477.1 hypothetical protein [Zongyanglinia huanghaiensis]
MTKRKPNLGISQLEVLISLAVMGLIAVLLANVLNFSRMSLNRAQEVSSEVGLFLTRNSLRHWGEEIPLSYNNETVSGYFHGKNTDLRFHTLISNDSFWGGELTTVHLHEDNGTLTAELDGLDAQTRKPLQTQHLLAKDIQSFRISYYGTKHGEPKARWHQSWDEATSLPTLTKIEWDVASSAAPPLILHPAKRDRQSVLSLGDVIPRH